MKYNFRQGIQHAPLVAGHPSFLTYNNLNGTITISLGVDLVRATAAYGDYNYIIEERQDAVDSWGPFTWNPAWGPEPGGPPPSPPPGSTPNFGGGFTSYLYWDINRATGMVSRGFTPRLPIYGSEPLNPANDQHWFDTATNTMKVWDGTRWVSRIRVFAGSFLSEQINENDLGSQVGITSQSTDPNDWYEHGYILFGADQKAIRYNDTNFVTSATPIMTLHGSFASPFRLELLNSTVLADEPIPAFFAVTNTGDSTVQLADGTNIQKRPIGLALRSANPGDPVDIVTSGIVYNDQWNWDSSADKDIYCSATGELVQGSVTYSNGADRVGTVLGPQTILVNIDLYALVGGGGGHPANTIAQDNSELSINDTGAPGEPNLKLKFDDVPVMTADANSMVYGPDYTLESGTMNAVTMNGETVDTKHLKFHGVVGAVGQKATPYLRDGAF